MLSLHRMNRYSTVFWFCFFFLFSFEGSAQDTDKVQDEKPVYAQIVNGPRQIRSRVSPDAPILGMAQRGEAFVILKHGDKWTQILYKDKKGWVETRFIKVVDNPSDLRNNIVFSDFILVIIILSLLIIAVLIAAWFINRSNKVSEEWFKSESSSKELTLIRSERTMIEKMLTDRKTTLKDSLEEVGFRVIPIKEPDKVIPYLYHHQPGIIVIDWHYNPKIVTNLEKILKSRASLANTTRIYYNVPDSPKIRSINKPNIHFLIEGFTDKELFQCLQSQVTSNTSKTIEKGIETSALAGEVGEQNLIDIFQFIEIGKKTGGLLIEDEKPKGIIYFSNGIITYAATRNKTGQEAVYEILGLSSGDFRFVLDRQPQSSNCHLQTLGVLMEWSKAKDESNRY